MEEQQATVDAKVFETIVHSIGRWLDERQAYLPVESYFGLAQLFYEHFVPDAPGSDDAREQQMRKLFEEQFVLEDSFTERQRQSDIRGFQRFSQVGMIAAIAALVSSFFSVTLGPGTVAKHALGVLLIGGVVSFIVIPILKRLPRDKQRVRRESIESSE